MHPVGLSLGTRMVATSVVLVSAVATVVTCSRGIRHNGRVGIYGLLGAYFNILLLLFLVGLWRDDGYGWAFIPMMTATLPWSAMVTSILTTIPAGWFPSSAIGGMLANFIIFVVVCGGANCAVLYFVVSRLFYRGRFESPRLHL